MKKKFLLIAFCFSCTCIFSQGYNTVVKGVFKTTKYETLRLITYDILTEDFNNVGKSTLDKAGNFSFKLLLDKPIVCKLFGEVFFITPHDSINIEAKENSQSPGGYDLKVIQGKNSNNYTFFRALEQEVPSPFAKFFKDPTFSWAGFKKISEDYYSKRLLFLKTALENNQLSPDFYNYLKQDIHFEYISSFFQPLYYKTGLSSMEVKQHLETLGVDTLIQTERNFQFTSFQQVLKQYFELLISTQIQNSEEFNQFEKQFSYVQKNFRGNSKEFLMALIFRKTVALPDLKYSAINDSIYRYAKKGFLNTEIISFISSKYKLYKNLYKEIPDSVLKTKLMRLDGSIVELKTILHALKGSNILLDNWASWCGPCISAMKEAKKYSREVFENNIVTLYLSQDSDVKAWKKRHTSLGLKKEHSFFIKDPNKVLLNYFNIRNIPHYILLDKNGNLLSQKSPGLTEISEILRLIRE